MDTNEKENITNKNNMDLKTILIESGIIITVAYIFLFVNTFFYRFGRLNYFGLGSEYIKSELPNDLTEILFSLFIIAIIFSYIFGLIWFINNGNALYKIQKEMKTISQGRTDAKYIKEMKSIHKSANKLKLLFILMPFIMIISFILFLIFWDTNLLDIMLLVIMLVAAAGGIILLKNSKVAIIFIVFFLFALNSHVNFLVGHNIASRTAKYSIADTYESKVIIYQDSDKFILMPYDEENNTLQRCYTIVTYDSIGEVSYKIFSGPVNVEN